LLGLAIFSSIAYIFDPIFHSIGYWLLVDVEFLRDFWTSIYQASVIPFTRFYNTVVMGSTFISIILFVPVLILTRWLVKNYREKIDPHIQKLPLFQMFKATKIYSMYQKIKVLSEL
jgi:uncharacterized protein (TIGR03546 family)